MKNCCSTIVDEIPYFVGIKLCGTVIAEKTSHMMLGREVKVCFIKAHKCEYNDTSVHNVLQLLPANKSHKFFCIF